MSEVPASAARCGAGARVEAGAEVVAAAEAVAFAEAGAMAPSSGWRARLELKFQSLDGRTRLTHRRHSGPLMVQRAFYPEAPRKTSTEPSTEASGAGVPAATESGAAAAPPQAAEPCHLYLLHPPGGVAGGDEIELEAHVGADAHALLTTPAAGKFYRRGAAGGALVRQNFNVDGVLEWLPQENLFHPDASVRLSTVVQLAPGARFVGWEISCLGMPARELTLQSGSLRQRLELWGGPRPLLIESLALDQDCLAPVWGLGGSAVLGTCLAYPATARDLDCARAAVEAATVEFDASCAPTRVACTLVDQVLVCRAIGARADRVRLAFTAMWRALRPALLGRAAVPPRIWAT